MSERWRSGEALAKGEWLDKSQPLVDTMVPGLQGSKARRLSKIKGNKIRGSTGVLGT